MPALRYRRPTEFDLAFVTDLFARPEMVAHRPVPVPDSPAISSDRLERDLAHWERHGYGRWAIEDGRRLVALGGLTATRDNSGLNLSYHVHPDLWGRGIASAIATEAVRFGFTELGAMRIRGLVRPSNPASLRILEKLGFRHEGTIRYGGAPTQVLALYPGIRPLGHLPSA